jgi:hypothetical protein
MSNPIEKPETDKKAWDRLPNESTKAYAAFVVYRDLGIKRSLRLATDEIYGEGSLNIRLLEKWSVRHRWVSRVDSYDAQLESTSRQAVEHERIERAKRHARLGLKLQEVGERRLRAKDFRAVSVRDTIQAIRTGVELERRAKGDDRPEPAAPATVNINVLQQISDEVSQHRARIIGELMERMRSGTIPPKEVECLPSPPPPEPEAPEPVRQSAEVSKYLAELKARQAAACTPSQSE